MRGVRSTSMTPRWRLAKVDNRHAPGSAKGHGEPERLRPTGIPVRGVPRADSRMAGTKLVRPTLSWLPPLLPPNSPVVGPQVVRQADIVRTRAYESQN
jgi:hypothetical protein